MFMSQQIAFEHRELIAASEIPKPFNKQLNRHFTTSPRFKIKHFRLCHTLS